MFTKKVYRADIPDGDGDLMVLRYALPIYIHLSSKCLRLAVPRQEFEEIDMTNNTFSELTVDHMQWLQ